MYYKETENKKVSLKRRVHSYELVLTFRKYFSWILSACIIVFASVYWFSFKFLLYESRLVIDVSPAPVFFNNQEETRKTIDLFRNSEYVFRTIQFVQSTQMVDHLIKKFDLYKHYDIAPSSAFSYARLIHVINNRVRISKSVYDNVIITVRDADREFTAAMANEIGVELNLIAKNYFTEIMSANMAYYQTLLRKLNTDFQNKIDQMNTAAVEFSRLKPQSLNPGNSNLILSTEESLRSASSNLENNTKQIFDLYQTQQWILNMIENEKIKFVSVVQKAVPDYSSHFFFRFALSVFGLVLIIGLALLLIYFIKAYHQYIRLLLSRTA